MSSDYESQWTRLVLKLVADPTQQAQLDQIETDKVTWQTFILASLKQLHGIFGSSIQNEIDSVKDTRALVRVQPEDLDKFKSALVLYTANLSMYGLEDVDARIEITETQSKELN